jgi:hypothetical protein
VKTAGMRRLSSAHILGLVALFAALGGGAYAAVTLPARSVGARQLKRGAVTPSKLSPSTKKLLKAKTGPAGAAGQAGPAGAAGTKGDQGVTGPVGPSDGYAGGASFGALTGSYTQIAAITVPAGQYLLQAKTTIQGHVAATAILTRCLIAPTAAGGPGTWDATSAITPAIAGQFASQVLTLTGADSFAGEQTVVLACKDDLAAADYDDARVVAIKVGAVHGLPVPID